MNESLFHRYGRVGAVKSWLMSTPALVRRVWMPPRPVLTSDSSRVSNFFLRTKTSSSAVKVNDRFLKSVQDVDERIIAKLKELQFMS